LPNPDVLDDLIAEAPEVPADVLAILGPAKANILRILKWRDPAQAPFRVTRPINASEAQWAALFDGGCGRQGDRMRLERGRTFRDAANVGRPDECVVGLLVDENQVAEVTAKAGHSRVSTAHTWCVSTAPRWSR
jgi:hypothetical protein